MAAPSVRAFGALAITISAQIASKLLLLYNPIDTESKSRCANSEYVDLGCLDYRPEYGYTSIGRECMKKYYWKQFTHYVKYYEQRIAKMKVLDMILLIRIIVLGLILCCTILASKTIHSLLKQRNSTLVEERKFQLSNEKMKSISPIIEKKEIQSSNEKMKVKCDNFEVEVLRSWFVSHVFLIDYVICRSVLSSAVWIIVTICVIFFYKSFYKSHEPISYKSIHEFILYKSEVPMKHISYRYYRSYVTPIYPFLSLIMVGWVIICWRWLATQLYWSPRYN